MSDTKGANNDPSMDDILASIRKIISDDEARAQVHAGASSPSAANAPSSPGAKRDDVLLLTDLVEEPPEVPPRPTPLPTQRIDPISAGEMPQPTVPPFAAATPVEAPVKQPSPETLVEQRPAARRAGPRTGHGIGRSQSRGYREGDAAADAEGLARQESATAGRALC